MCLVRPVAGINQSDRRPWAHTPNRSGVEAWDAHDEGRPHRGKRRRKDGSNIRRSCWHPAFPSARAPCLILKPKRRRRPPNDVFNIYIHAPTATTIVFSPLSTSRPWLPRRRAAPTRRPRSKKRSGRLDRGSSSQCAGQSPPLVRLGWGFLQPDLIDLDPSLLAS